MVLVHKKGKYKTTADSYRPISLISCMGRLTERLINTRLMWHFETIGLISPEHAAFRQERSTDSDHLHHTGDGREKKEHPGCLD